MRAFYFAWTMMVVILAGCSEGTASPDQAGPGSKNSLGAQMPHVASWASESLGKKIEDLYPGSQEAPDSCIGFVDGLTEYFADDEGARYEGWAWSTAKSAPYPRLLATDADGIVQGSGETSVERPDVPAAVPSITTTRVGFVATASITKGVVKVFGINDQSRSACLIGEFSSN